MTDYRRAEVKFKVTMKDPDTLHECIRDAVAETVKNVEAEDEAAALVEVREERCRKVAAKWFKYGEYLTVEIDTDSGTCVVVPV